jgi:hypothetical protein
VVEVYPAASLKCWGLSYRGHKQPHDTQPLGVLMDDLLAAAPWLEPGRHERLCRTSHDAANAVIAALTARAAARGLRPGRIKSGKQRPAPKAGSPCQPHH